MDNAKAETFGTVFHNLGGKLLFMDEHGLSAHLRVNKCRISPFVAPGIKDNSETIAVVMLFSLFQSIGGALFLDQRFILPQIRGTNMERSIFVISTKFSLEPAFYTMIHHSSYLTDVVVDLKQNILVTCEVCFIGDKTFSIMDTYTAELTNTVIATLILTYGVIDMKDRKLVNIPSFVTSKTPHLKYDIKPEYIDYDKSSESVVSESFAISNEHIDFNGHTNILVYITAALKTFLTKKVTQRNNRLRKFFILFKKEYMLGDELKVVAWRDSLTEQCYCKILKNNDILSAFARATFNQNHKSNI